MKLFEYQAKEAFREKGLPTPKGVLVRGMDELDGAFAEVGFPCVLKSQVLSGGRGKAGLIKVVKDAESAKATAKTLFESEHNVRMLLVEEAVDIDREIYLSITVDPVESKIMLIGCAEGGVEIEKLAATDPDKIVTVRVDIAEGLGGYHVNNLTYGMGLSGDLGKQVGAVVRGLYKTFRAYDAQLAEINPLFITKDGKAIAGDGKLIIDDNSVWRQPSYPLTRDYFDSEVEFEAAQEGIPYLQFNGDIALMCAGAGLTTTVFDLINDAGPTTPRPSAPWNSASRPRARLSSWSPSGPSPERTSWRRASWKRSRPTSPSSPSSPASAAPMKRKPLPSCATPDWNP